MATLGSGGGYGSIGNKGKIISKKSSSYYNGCHKWKFYSCFSANPVATGANATIVPTLVPMDSDMKHAAKNIPPNNNLSGSICKVRFTAASMAPICLAPWAKAPAKINIHIIMNMFLLLAPEENKLIRSSRLMRCVMRIA